MTDVNAFVREIDSIVADIPELVRDAQVELFRHAYGVAVDRTPVRTGALRAENVAVEGDPLNPLRITYESPDRIGPGPESPQFDLAPGESPLPPPSAIEAAQGMSDVRPFGVIGIRNARFYANLIHNGGPNHAPRPWMQHAADSIANRRVAIRDRRFR